MLNINVSNFSSQFKYMMLLFKQKYLIKEYIKSVLNFKK